MEDTNTPETQAEFDAYLTEYIAAMREQARLEELGASFYEAQAADDLEHKAWLAANPDFNGDPDPQKF